MASGADVRRIALALPRTTEHLIREHTKYRVGRLVYASVSADEERLGFGFPRDERAGLVATDPVKFMMPLAADMRYQWVRARLPALEVEELRELLIDAWCMVVPKKVRTAYLDELGLPPLEARRAGRGRAAGAGRPASGLAGRSVQVDDDRGVVGRAVTLARLAVHVG